MPHHTVLELKRHWGTAELQEVWKKTEGRQDEERSDVGNERGGAGDIQRRSYLTFTFTSYLRPRGPKQVLKIVEAAD